MTSATGVIETVGIAEISIQPPAGTWRELAGGERNEAARGFRAELGLPTGKPIVMSGHQAGVWHAGILAKLESLVAFAEAAGMHPVWLVVDQDDNDPTRIGYPARGEGGALSRETWALTEEPVAPGAPNGRRPPIEPSAAPRAGFNQVDDGLERIAGALRDSTGAGSLGEQFALAAIGLSGLACPILHATAVARTSAYAELIAEMGADPQRCTGAYNAAAEARPGAGVRPLSLGERSDRVELPIWNIGGPFRKPVYAADLAGLDPGATAPKALLMMGLLRSLGCDLFVHGTGGGGDGRADGNGAGDENEGYDAVTDAWFEAWRGRAPGAPGVVATATLTLDLGLDIPTEAEVENARNTAHKAQHDPALVGDEERARRKQVLVEQIERAKREQQGKPSELFREMQQLLKDHREHNGWAIQRLGREAEALAARASAGAIAHDRTWTFPLNAPAALDELRSRIRAAFAEGSA